jgi:hypothetical protein
VTEPLDANRTPPPPEPPPAGAPAPAPERPGFGRRLRGAWRALAGDQRLAAGAALALFICLFLPWYSTSPTHVPVNQKGLSTSHTGLATFGWVEAAVLLVAVAVLFLLFARAERRAFHLPGGDGGVIVAAGVWVAFLVLWRFFDRPDFGSGVAVGLQWGIFVTLAVAAVLAYAGTRIRAAQRPEPPLERAGEPRPAAAPGTVATRPLHEPELQPSDEATAATRVHRGDPAPDDPTTALPRRRER